MRPECHGLGERQGTEWWHGVGGGNAVAATTPGGTRARAGREALPQPLCQEPQEQDRGKHSANLGEQTPGAGSTQGFASLGCPFLSFPSEKAPLQLRGCCPAGMLPPLPGGFAPLGRLGLLRSLAWPCCCFKSAAGSSCDCE